MKTVSDNTSLQLMLYARLVADLRVKPFDDVARDGEVQRILQIPGRRLKLNVVDFFLF